MSRPHTSSRNRTLGVPCLNCGSYCVPIFNEFTNRCATCNEDRTVRPEKPDPIAESVRRHLASLGGGR